MADSPVLEHAVLDVQAGQGEAFEAAFAQARGILVDAPGCRSVALYQCAERPDRYLLLVEWTSIAAHTHGFRGSPAYQEWRSLLHHYYEPMPTVEHYIDLPGG